MASCTARKDKNGNIISYQIKVSRGRDTLTGKQLTPYTMTYTPPEGWSKKAIERDLTKAIGEFQAACNRGEVLTKKEKRVIELDRINEADKPEPVEEQKPTFKEYVEIFLNEKAATLAPVTYDGYKSVLEKAADSIGSVKMEELTPQIVKKYISDLQLNGKNNLTGKKLSHGSISAYYSILHSFFSHAVEENEIIQLHPMHKMKRPKPRKDEKMKKAVVYNENEVKYIFECLDKEPLKWKAMIIFAIDSGCRRGEIIALRWEDINLMTGEVIISRNIQYTPEMGKYETSTKNRKNRVIYINPPVIEVLKAWKQEQEMFHRAQGLPLLGYCFPQDTGEIMSPQSMTGYIRRFGKKYNLPGIHPHALRHTMATISIANGADIVSISEKLGHCQPSITLNIYSHVNEEAQKRANNILYNAIYQKDESA